MKNVLNLYYEFICKWFFERKPFPLGTFSFFIVFIDVPSYVHGFFSLNCFEFVHLHLTKQLLLFENRNNVPF